MAARFWTAGADLYAPACVVVHHLWTRSYRPTFRELLAPHDQELAAKAEARRARWPGRLGVGLRSVGSKL